MQIFPLRLSNINHALSLLLSCLHPVNQYVFFFSWGWVDRMSDICQSSKNNNKHKNIKRFEYRPFYDGLLQIPDWDVWPGRREDEAESDHGLPGGAAPVVREEQEWRDTLLVISSQCHLASTITGLSYLVSSAVSSASIEKKVLSGRVEKKVWKHQTQDQKRDLACNWAPVKRGEWEYPVIIDCDEECRPPTGSLEMLIKPLCEADSRELCFYWSREEKYHVLVTWGTVT